jgi:hypothetical protein
LYTLPKLSHNQGPDEQPDGQNNQREYSHSY